MRLFRVIPVLLIDGEGLVKTEKFRKPRYLGDPVNAVTIFNEKRVDELVVADIAATDEARPPNFELLEDLATQAFMPLAYAGGIRSVADVERLFAIGFDKVILNSINFESLDLLRSASARYGAQSIMCVLDVAVDLFGRQVILGAGKRHRIDPVEWAQTLVREGAGELVVTSVDREGSLNGYDIELVKRISSAVAVPVIANGGAGCVEHFKEVRDQGGAAAAAAGSFFVFHGKHKAVLITYPDYTRLEQVLYG